MGAIDDLVLLRCDAVAVRLLPNLGRLLSHQMFNSLLALCVRCPIYLFIIALKINFKFIQIG